MGTKTRFYLLRPLLGGSRVVISRVRSPLIWAITMVTLLITPLITTHEPPSILEHYYKYGIIGPKYSIYEGP